MSTDSFQSDSPFLQGLLAPVQDERNDIDLEIHGELPEGLNGIFTRNGPNPQFAPLNAYHPFDGDGMVHAVYFEDGRVRYRNRWVENAGLLAERKRGKACYGSISEFSATDPEVVEEAGGMKNVANTHFVRHGGRYLALMEAASPIELTRGLETVGEYDFDGKLVGPMTAHPKIDPQTGEMLFFGYSPFAPFLRYHVADASGALVHSVEIDIPNSVMMHDFVFTENYVLFFDSPAIFDVMAMMRSEPGIRWEPEKGTRIGVLPRRGKGEDVRWFEAEKFYAVHFFNAWDDGNGKIEVHGPAFDDMPGGLQFDNPVQTGEPYPRIWKIDLQAGTLSYEQCDDQSGEFPRVNDDYAGAQTRYHYNSIARDWEFEFNFNGVIKYDLEEGTSQKYTYGDTVKSGEHVFAPNANPESEDDGYLLAYASDADTEKSELMILDAQDVAAGPVARVQFPRRVPIGFHANWLAES